MPAVHRYAVGTIIERSGVSKAEVARDAGIVPGYLSDILSGRRRTISASALERLAGALKVSKLALLANPDEPEWTA